MDVNSEIDRIATKYHCDPLDPNFAILEAVVRKSNQILDAIPNGSKADLLKEDWRNFIETLHGNGETLNGTIQNFSDQLARAENIGKKIAQNLLASKHLSLRDKAISGLIGMTGPLITLIFWATWYGTSSLPAQLAKSNVHLSIESSSKATRITLQGPSVINAAKGKQSVMVEFGR